MTQPCKYCGKIIHDDQELKDHEKEHEGSSNRPETEHRHTCKYCGKGFSRKDNLKRHLQICKNSDQRVNKSQSLTCCKCSKKLTRKDNLERHERVCSGALHSCPRCQKKCASAYGLRRHIQWHDKAPVKRNTETDDENVQPGRSDSENISQDPLPKQYRCRCCTSTFPNRRELYIHGRREHYNQTGGALQRRPWTEQNAPWLRDGEEDGLRVVYEANESLILDVHHRGPIQSTYNFPLDNDVSLVQLMDYATDIYQREQRAFRLNMAFGVILQNRESGQFRYYIPYRNVAVFERPIFISKRSDLNHLRNKIRTMDIMQQLLRMRPDTKWIPVLVTNVHFTVVSTNYPIGSGILPDYLMNKDSLYPLVRNQHNGKPYDDHLCAFRCLALHHDHEIRCIEGPTKQFYQRWSDESVEEFGGIDISDFPQFETQFEVNLEVYALQEDGFARSLYKSRGQQESTMYVNLHEHHMSYIKNFELYAQKFQCKTCDRHFDHSGHLHRHQRVCDNRTKYVYPGGFHRPKDSIFDRLDDFGIEVPVEDRFFPWFICYDFEALLQKIHDQATESLQWTHKHIPVSVSVCSNVQGYEEPICLVEPDQDLLIQRMTSVMNTIAERVVELSLEKWGWIVKQIDERINEEESEDNDSQESKRMTTHPLRKVQDQLEAYMRQVPAIGFNSAKYDLNLIKQCLAKHLNLHEERDTFVVKKNNAYACIATDRLKFLDMSQFLAAGSSYAEFLKAYRVEEQKGFFPYEWFDHTDKLKATSLPPHEDFYSRLKGKNIDDAEYQFCLQVWKQQNMSTFSDFLIWYNNLDVGPFVEAVKRFQDFYFKKEIDVFKTAISVPGIARQLLFRTAAQEDVTFALFDYNNSDLYKTIKQNIIGGPSIIFTRHHNAGKSLIRGQKKCGAILGFDANALYLQSIGKEMPVGPFIRRQAGNDFKPELRDRYMSAYYWMDWLMYTQHVKIQHRLNSGREVRVGRYLVDGFKSTAQGEDKPTVYQFHGCYWHGHNCCLTRHIKDEEWLAKREQKYKKTMDITSNLKKRCHVIVMWECQFKQYCQNETGIDEFINSRRPSFFQHHKGKIQDIDIILGVVSGDLFGMVEVDIEVPEQWPCYFQDPRMSPQDYFREMSPLFCTTDIPFEVIGDHMQDHVKRYNLSTSPRRLLVGGMKARQILLATPLLQWYIKHGLVVTKVYQVIEFQAQRCFKKFVEEVSEARRTGDRDTSTAIIADTMKVIGNSAYGSLIMDKTKHKTVKFVQGENETCLAINDPLFCKLECLDQENQYYELAMSKRKINLDLPIQLGYFILQYAKLRMLEFYYDFMDVYVDRSDFEYCEMDTDSAYMAISGSSLENIIKPKMRTTYLNSLQSFCTDVDIEADAHQHWFPRTCCEKHATFDKRTPGLFKLEYQGDEMIGLCSKTYIVRKAKVETTSVTRMIAHQLLRRACKLKKKRCLPMSRRIQEYKFSAKGISKKNVKAPMTQFRKVLKTGKAQSGLNRGFRVRNNTIFTYTQERKGFSYFYCKRKVSNDGIHTEPLDITLCPVQQPEVDDQELVNILVELLESNE